MVNNWPDNVIGRRESISLRASFDKHSSSDLRPTSLGTAGWGVGLVSVSFERVTLEERGLGLLLLGRGISRTLALFGRSNH